MFMKLLAKIILILFIYSSIAAAQWEPDVRLTEASGHSRMANNAARGIVVDGDTIHVVWTDSRDGNSEIYYKRSLDRGNTWGADIRLTDDPSVSALPALAVNGLMLHVSWYDMRNQGNFEIYYKRSQDGGNTWEPDVRLTDDIEYSWYPSIALTNSNVHVIWRESRAGNWEVFYKRSTDQGTTWNADTNLSNAAGSSETPCIVNAGSMLHIVWFDNRDGGAYEIYYKRSIDEGITWEPDVRLTNNPEVSFGPCAAVLGSSIHVAWQEYHDGSWEIYYKKSTDNGISWTSNLRLTNAPETSESPSIVASGPNVHVVWWDNRDGNYEIYYKRSSDEGMTWEPDVRLTDDGSWSQWPQIAITDSILHVIWEDGRISFDNNELFYKRNRTGNLGTKETDNAESQIRLKNAVSTILTGPLIMPPGMTVKVFDITGRNVLPDQIGPGIYFMEIDNKLVQKIIKVR